MANILQDTSLKFNFFQDEEQNPAKRVKSTRQQSLLSDTDIRTLLS